MTALRYNRRIDIRPCCDIHRSDVVSRTSESTLNTTKSISRRSIFLSNMMASRTFPGRIPWVHNMDWNTNQFCLIRDEGTELSECPTVQRTTLSFANRCSFSDVHQIFKCNSRSSVFGFGHEFLRNAMILILHESLKLSRSNAEMPFGRFRALLLEVRSDLQRLSSYLFYSIAGEGLSFGIHRQIDNSQVDSKNFLCIHEFNRRNVESGIQKEDIPPQDKINLALDPMHLRGLILTEDHSHNLPSLESRYADMIEFLEGKYSFIIYDCTRWFECGFYRSIAFVCFAGLGDCSDGHLSRKMVFLSEFLINYTLYFDFVRTLELVSQFSNFITSCIELYHRLVQCLPLFGRWQEFDLQSLFHVIDKDRIYIYILSDITSLSPHSSHGLKAGGFLRHGW